MEKLVEALQHAIDRDTLISQEEKEDFMTPARAEVERKHAELLSQGRSQGITQGALAMIHRLWTQRFGAAMPAKMAQRLHTVQDLGLLEQVQDIVASAAHTKAALAQIAALPELPAN